MCATVYNIFYVLTVFLNFFIALYCFVSLDLCTAFIIIIIIIINVKINVALSENASKTRYTIKIKLKLRK